MFWHSLGEVAVASHLRCGASDRDMAGGGI
jgi:hypothetical protein